MERVIEMATGDSVKFSRHAAARLEKREIAVNQGMLQQLGSAISTLEKKGGRLSLVMFEQLAMLVSVSKRTVITVIGKDQLMNNIFTDIDSVIFVAA